MSLNIPFACECGTVQGTIHGVSASHVNNAVCYCIDCQTWAHHLGKASNYLDAHGGTHVVQVAPGSVTVEQGIERLGLKRLSPKGIFRWYATCCGAPMGNTLPTSYTPFWGFPRQRLQVEDAALGQLYRVMGKYAKQAPASLAIASKFGPAATMNAVLRAPGWLLRGTGNKSPLFRAGKPIVEPEILTQEQRAQARDAALRD